MVPALVLPLLVTSCDGEPTRSLDGDSSCAPTLPITELDASSDTGAEVLEPNTSNGLAAAYWEIVDNQTALVGLHSSLEASGWRAQPLQINESPDQLGVDVIVLGSFISDHPQYASYMAEYGPALQRFLDGGGAIVQFTQTRTAEPQPLFLPPGLSAPRTDTDISEVFALAREHALTNGLDTSDRDDGLVELPSPTPPSGIAWRPACWDCFHDQIGFKVLAAARRDGEFPAMLEATSANGRGRIIVSGMPLDKIRNAAGEIVAEPQVLAASKTFFSNLAQYVMLLKKGQLPSPQVTPPYVAPLATVPQPANATVIVFPDTQNYSFSAQGFDSASIFRSQMTWANESLKQLNTAFMLNLGDIVEHNVTSEWMLAASAYGVLPAQQPLLLTTGNHDHGPNGSGGVRDSRFSEFFPTKRFEAMSTFGGSLESAENSYHLVDINGETWLVLGLEWAPRSSTLQWAKDILAAHPNHKAIVATHAYMFSDETRYDHKGRSNSQPWNPHWYFRNSLACADVNDGQEIWEKLVKVSPNVRIVLSGHVAKDGIGRMTSHNDAGLTVHQLAFNFQDYPLGGGGYLRTFEFLRDRATVRVRTYSPFLNKHLTDAQNQFELTIESQ